MSPFDGAFYPITREWAFIDAPTTDVVDRFVAWQRRLGERPDRFSFIPFVRTIDGDVKTALRSLLPLVDLIRTRYLFAPTASNWTAYFDNGHRGGDPGPPVSYLAERIPTRWVRLVVDLPKRTMQTVTNRRHGDLVLEFNGPAAVFGPDLTDKRILDLTIDEHGRRSLRQLGDPLPFEQVERYRARLTTDRFNLATMTKYLNALGIDAFNPAFYLPTGTATLVEKVGPRHPDATDWSLEDAQRLLDGDAWTAARVI